MNYLENGSSLADGTYLDANNEFLDIGYLKHDGLWHQVVEGDFHQRGYSDTDRLVFPGSFTIRKQ